jgi:HlyD family secretion protein
MSDEILATPPDSQESPQAPMHRTKSVRWFQRKRYWIIGGVMVLVLASALLFTRSGSRKSSFTYTTKSVVRTNLRQTVDATGTINAVTTVQVGSQVSGTIMRLYVDFNSHVKKGELIAEIDPRVYEGQVLQSKADLDNARASLAAARANLADARAKAAQTKADYERMLPLSKRGIVSPQQVDASRTSAESSQAQVAANESAVKQAQAQISQRAAALEIAQTNLNYTKIYAPIDGTVINRAVDIGQTVAASFQTPTLFTIAQDLAKMQLHVSTNEGDIGRVHAGQMVTFRVDAFRGETFQGHVSQVRMNATTVQNVVTYETIVDFENRDLKLFPGMTAYVAIPIQSADNVLAVPNAALRFNPNIPRNELTALLTKYGVALPTAGNDPSLKTDMPGANTAIVWKLRADQSFEPVLVRTSITNHSYTAVTLIKGKLDVGESVITAEQAKPGMFDAA